MQLEKPNGKCRVNLGPNECNFEQSISSTPDGFASLIKSTITGFNISHGHENGTISEIKQLDEAFWLSIDELSEIFPHLTVTPLAPPRA